MKVSFSLSGGGGTIKIVRESGDKKFYGMNGESQFLHHLCKHLNQRGFILIKKLVWKDNHMMGDNYMHYLRPPKSAGTKPELFPHIYLYSGHYAINGAHEEWNQGEESLIVTGDIFERQPNWKEMIKRRGKLYGFDVEIDKYADEIIKRKVTNAQSVGD